MGLRDWTFDLAHEPPANPDCYATCSPTYGQRRAVLRFDTAVREWPLERTRRVVVHELLHCHLDRMDTIFNGVADELSPQAKRVAESAWTSVLEDACDDIAVAWADRMPLIQWPGTPRGAAADRAA